MPWPTSSQAGRRRLARRSASPVKAAEVFLPPETAPIAKAVTARSAEEAPSPPPPPFEDRCGGFDEVSLEAVSRAPPPLDDLVDELDEVPIEAAKGLVLRSRRSLRPREPQGGQRVDADDAGGAAEADAQDCGLAPGVLPFEPAEEPLRLPRLPLAAHLVTRPPWRGIRREVDAPRGSLSARVVGSCHDRQTGGAAASGSSTWRSPRGRPLTSQELQRTIQNVDFGRLEARLREADCAEPPPAPPPSHREVIPKLDLRLGRQNSIASCDTEDESSSIPLAGLVELEAMESVFSADGDSSLQDTTCDDEVQVLIDSSGGVCGGGCRFTKLAGGFRRFRGPDADVVGGLHSFLSRADDTVLSYILHPARGDPPMEPPVGLLTKL